MIKIKNGRPIAKPTKKWEKNFKIQEEIYFF